MTRIGFPLSAWTRCLCCWLLLSIPIWGQARIVLARSGSSLAGPVVSVWEKGFSRQEDTIRVGYVTMSSVEGIRAVRHHVGDFAMGEIPLTSEQLQDPKVELAQVPIAVVGVVPIYNLPGNRHVRFTGGLLAQIYMGRVSSWNDRRIATLNPGVLLPRLPIVVVQRPEGTGTRYILTEFLSQSSQDFRSWIAVPQHREWGELMARKSNDMVEKVAVTPGAIGYVERSFAIRSGLAYGSVQNRSGNFVEASEASIHAACEAKGKLSPDDFPRSLVNADGANSYPLVSFAWAYVPASGLTPERRTALRQFLAWSLQDGQLLMHGLNYSPLPADLAYRARAELRSVLR